MVEVPRTVLARPFAHVAVETRLFLTAADTGVDHDRLVQVLVEFERQVARLHHLGRFREVFLLPRGALACVRGDGGGGGMSAGKSRTREQRGGGEEREGENSNAPCWIASSAAFAFSASSWSCALRSVWRSARLRKARGPMSTRASGRGNRNAPLPVPFPHTLSGPMFSVQHDLTVSSVSLARRGECLGDESGLTYSEVGVGLEDTVRVSVRCRGGRAVRTYL